MHSNIVTIDNRTQGSQEYLDLLDVPLVIEREYMPSSKILLFETDPALQYTRSRILTKERYAVTVTSSFGEAVLAAAGGTFDLLVMSVNNAELLTMSLAQFPVCLPILLIADRTIAHELVENTHGSMRSYVFLPCSNAKLKKAVSQAIDTTRTIKESIRNDVLKNLGSANHNLAIESGIDLFMENIAQIAHDGTSADYIAITVNNDTNDEILAKAERGKYCTNWQSLLSGLDVINEPVVISDKNYDDPELLKGMKKAGISGIIYVPLVTKGNIVGSIKQVKLADHGYFADSDLSLTSILAWWTSMALDNTRIYLDYFKEHLHTDRLLDQISFAQENERKRVAVEIHDGVAQWLVGASYDIKLCSRLISESNYSELECTIENIRGVLHKSVKELRRAISNLPLPPLEEIGFYGVIERLAAKLTEEGIRCSVYFGDNIPKLSLAQQKTFYWLIQESVTNIKKHANATEVEIRIESLNDIIKLNVIDNGVGFSIEKTMESRLSLEHIGLLGMRERSEYLNGYLEIDSEPGKGTSINFSFSPYPSELVTIART